MPHIQPERRPPIRVPLDAALKSIENEGDLTYALYYLVVRYAQRKPTNFKRWNDSRGTLFSAADEVYRLKMAPHEDRAILRNGEAC